MASDRAVPPDDISAAEFFTRWVPDHVAADPERRTKLAGTTASIEFTLTAPRREVFTVYIDDGAVMGTAAPHRDPDLRVELDELTWRALNRGGMSAPEALLRRKVKIHGDFLLALKLHLILA